jgi:hypothetical protein
MEGGGGDARWVERLRRELGFELCIGDVVKLGTKRVGSERRIVRMCSR